MQKTKIQPVIRTGHPAFRNQMGFYVENLVSSSKEVPPFKEFLPGCWKAQIFIRSPEFAVEWIFLFWLIPPSGPTRNLILGHFFNVKSLSVAHTALCDPAASLWSLLSRCCSTYPSFQPYRTAFSSWNVSPPAPIFRPLHLFCSHSYFGALSRPYPGVTSSWGFLTPPSQYNLAAARPCSLTEVPPT